MSETETSMLETVLQYGTARAAAIGQFAAGKTGTTSNFGDAWFVGWDKKYTVAVWVGYPNKLIPMTTDFGGKPVFGGTYPALIWHDFMLAAMGIEKERAAQTALRGSKSKSGPTQEVGVSTATGTTGEASAAGAPATHSPVTPSSKSTAPQSSAPQSSAPQSAAPQTPAPEPSTPAPAAPATPTPASPAPVDRRPTARQRRNRGSRRLRSQGRAPDRRR